MDFQNFVVMLSSWITK